MTVSFLPMMSLISLILPILVACAGRSLMGMNPEEPSPEDAEVTVSATMADAYDHFMRGAYKEAAAAYGNFIDDPEHRVQAITGLARCQLRLGEYDHAIGGLVSLPVGASAERHYLLAQLLALKGNYSEVLKHTKAAIEIDRNHAGARLLSASTLELLGRRDDAIQAYRWFERQLVERADLPNDAEWITDTALGFLRCSILTETDVPRRTQHVLHEMLQVAYERVDRTYWPARIAAADLLRAKFNNDPDDGSVSDYNAALKINPNLCEAHVGLGEVALEDWDFEETQRRTELALKVNPNYAPAIHLLARSLLRERRYKQAAETCDRALAVNPKDVIALSIKAAASVCQDDTDEVARLRERAYAVNARSTTIHRILGDALGGIHQYAAAEQEYIQAVDLDPTDANARTELGMLYMMWGYEEKARDALDAAWALDPYNQRTKFTLELLESLQQFARVETDHFIVRYDSQRDPALGAQAAAYLEEIYPTVTEDYATSLPDKTIVELFPTQRAFAVRITGNPWIHTIGACTGRVIALASPRQAPELSGTYNYAQVLLHEFTHTVTLAATANRIPHWFTEGLAVSQQGVPRPFEWTRLLADAVRRDRLFTLESIDWAFIRPKRPTDRPSAYAQSAWMCEYIAERFGYETIQQMLKRFRNGQTQREVFAEQLGLDLGEFDRDFAQWARPWVARWGFDLTPPEDPGEVGKLTNADSQNATLAGRLARAEFDAGRFEQALVTAQRTIKLDPDEPFALDVLARIMEMNIEAAPSNKIRQQYESEALLILNNLSRVDPNSWIAPRLLGEIALRRKGWDQAVERFKQLQRLCPMDPASWRGLAGVYLERRQDDLALPQLLELARIQPNDAEVPAQLAAIYRTRDRMADALYWYRQALYCAPFNIEIRQAYANTCMHAQDAHAALNQYATLTMIQSQEVKHFENAATAAHKAGKNAQAVEFARQAVALDPASPARALLD
ncbi:MAG: tetratricopeptide repeat protein [Phycisphaerales bacterium]|nr:MAG: tetratricopeptide repeat protein [Phycisphaerales bacterium]